MLRYTPEICFEIINYLTDHKIPYRVYENVGLITFRAISKGGLDKYQYRVNISQNSFWIEVSAPVVVPQKEKVMDRMERFCCRANLRDNTGGFLVLNEDREKLMYRLRVPCFADPEEVIRTTLPVPAQMLDHYKEQIALLVQGKRSVNEAMKHLDRTCRWNRSSCLLPPEQESRECSVRESRTPEYLRDLMEAYFCNCENIEKEEMP